MDDAVTLDERLEQELERHGFHPDSLSRLPLRPILVVCVCRACGAHVIARATRPWDVDRAMRDLGLSERDVLAGRRTPTL